MMNSQCHLRPREYPLFWHGCGPLPVWLCPIHTSILKHKVMVVATATYRVSCTIARRGGVWIKLHFWRDGLNGEKEISHDYQYGGSDDKPIWASLANMGVTSVCHMTSQRTCLDMKHDSGPIWVNIPTLFTWVTMASNTSFLNGLKTMAYVHIVRVDVHICVCVCVYV